MITLSLAPNGSLQAFAEPQGPQDRGYYLDLPQDDPEGLQRIIMQTMLRRQAQANASGKGKVVPVPLDAITKWLATHPNTKPAPKGFQSKPGVSLADLMAAASNIKVPVQS